MSDIMSDFFMHFEIERPKALYGFAVLAVLLLIRLVRYARLVHFLMREDSLRVRLSFALRTFFFVLSLSFFILAYTGISWGTMSVPVQKSGHAVSFVFDISFSMLARDGKDGKTRLESAALYAEELLAQMEQTSVSVVLAKGDGVVAIPLTEDKESVLALLRNLSPFLMSSFGSGLGKGIEAAISSFPVQSSQAPYIWLFTDGEETATSGQELSLLSALNDAVKYGIPVAIIGFGQESESKVLAGDGHTEVHTALRSEKIREAIDAVQLKSPQKKENQLIPAVSFVRADERGSAYTLFSNLWAEKAPHRSAAGQEELTVAYEVQRIRRHNLFMEMGIISLVLAFISGEFGVFDRHKKLRRILLSLLCVGFLTGCSDSTFSNGRKILEGRLEWNRKNYQQATANFLDALEHAEGRGDVLASQYALYGLAVTYLMQDESEATLERFSQLAPDAPAQLRFAVLYNTGILAHRKGNYEEAVQFFKQALAVDSTSVEAKINLELSLSEVGIQQKSQGQSMSSVSENNDSRALENEVYSIMRKKEQDKWKNQEQEKKESGSLDY